MDGTSLHAACGGGDCSIGLSTPAAWQYYPGDPGTFIPPNATSVSCFGSGFFTPYQLSVAGCVQTPVACNQKIAIDVGAYGPNRDSDTAYAADCLIHAGPGSPFNGTVPPPGDSVDTNNIPPFEFLTGASNPLVTGNILPPQTDVVTSDSLVTVPVFDSSTPPNASGVQVIGFVQLFLQPSGYRVEEGGGPSAYKIRTMVINMVGCGTNASGTPVYGNGPSAVPVRLIANPPAN